MRRACLLLLAAVIVPGATAVAEVPPSVEPASPPSARSGVIPPAIQSYFTAYFRAVEAGDPEGILALIDTDFLLKWPSGPPIHDRDRLRTALMGLQQRVRQEIVWEVLEGRAQGDWAWARVKETTTHFPKAGGAPRTFTGAHLVILRKVGGRWLLHRDYSALDEPPAPAR